MQSLLEALREADALRDKGSADGNHDEIVIRETSNSKPVFAPDAYIESLPSEIQGALEGMGISRLYKHQADAIDAIFRGEDLVLMSPTASGKTLCFNIPIISHLLSNYNDKALMLYPMNALAHDQRNQLVSLTERLGKKIDSWHYLGDTPNEERSVLRQSPPPILITNPEMLNMSFLGHWDKWDYSFLKHLKFIVIDEIHEYRGFFGTNMAMLLRRLFHKLYELKAHPQVILSSATCANPLEHAKRLCGKEFTVIRDESGMKPRRYFAFISPKIPGHRFYEIYLLRIARAGLACIKMGLSTIVFCPSRRFTEDVMRKARQEAEKLSLDAKLIAPYRSGYRPDERRRIEKGLRTGDIRLVFSTNALEIGIDIGRLDVCILAGFPDNVMSAWQRIGRTGRSWDKTAYVLFYAMNNAVDQFYATNIDAFLDKPLDEIIIGLDNEEIMKKHIPCLINEVSGPIDEDSKPILGEYFYEAAKTAPGTKVRHRTNPQQKVSLRGMWGGTYNLIYEGREIGTISEQQLFREAYIGAIYNHCGKAYSVKNHGAGEITLENAEPHRRTEPFVYTIVADDKEIISAVRHNHTAALYYGALTIFDNFSGYKVIDEIAGETIDEVRLEPMGRSKKVRAFWLSIEDLSKLDAAWCRSGLLALEQLLFIGSPFTIPCDRHDLSSTNTINKQPLSVYVYETVPGGIGIVEKIFYKWREVLKHGINITKKCSCNDGCPRCLHASRFSSESDLPSKRIGIEFAEWLLEVTDSKPDEILDIEMMVWKPNK